MRVWGYMKFGILWAVRNRHLIEKVFFFNTTWNSDILCCYVRDLSPSIAVNYLFFTVIWSWIKDDLGSLLPISTNSQPSFLLFHFNGGASASMCLVAYHNNCYMFGLLSLTLEALESKKKKKRMAQEESEQKFGPQSLFILLFLCNYSVNTEHFGGKKQEYSVEWE